MVTVYTTLSQMVSAVESLPAEFLAPGKRDTTSIVGYKCETLFSIAASDKSGSVVISSASYSFDGAIERAREDLVHYPTVTVRKYSYQGNGYADPVYTDHDTELVVSRR